MFSFICLEIILKMTILFPGIIRGEVLPLHEQGGEAATIVAGCLDVKFVVCWTCNDNKKSLSNEEFNMI